MTDKIAIIADIHGNIHALDAVLDDIHKRGIDTIYCLGDLAGKGPDGDLVVDRCHQICDVILRGNWDEALQHQQQDPARQWWQANLGQQRIQYLANLPNSYDFWLSGKRIRLYHASHISEHHRITGYAAPETHQAMFTNTEFTGFEDPEPDIVGYGDLHAAFLLSPCYSGKLLFNAGSVGNPLDVPIAVYVVMTGHLGSEEPDAFNMEFMRVHYDIEAQIKRAYTVNMPETQVYAIELRTAIYRGENHDT